jgi:hypothetical protein
VRQCWEAGRRLGLRLQFPSIFYVNCRTYCDSVFPLTAAVDGDASVGASVRAAGHVEGAAGAVHLVAAVTRHAVALVAVLLRAVTPRCNETITFYIHMLMVKVKVNVKVKI